MPPGAGIVKGHAKEQRKENKGKRGEVWGVKKAVNVVYLRQGLVKMTGKIAWWSFMQ
jgi:hypothetical protein